MRKYISLFIVFCLVTLLSFSLADEPNDIDYEYAFVRDCGEYCIYYIFDMDDCIVRSFVSNDGGVMCGSFIYDGTHTFTITWASYWQEKFVVADLDNTVFDRKTGAYLFDANGFDWAYGHTDVEEALAVLCQPNYRDMELE